MHTSTNTDTRNRILLIASELKSSPTSPSLGDTNWQVTWSVFQQSCNRSPHGCLQWTGLLLSAVWHLPILQVKEIKSRRLKHSQCELTAGKLINPRNSQPLLCLGKYRAGIGPKNETIFTSHLYSMLEIISGFLFLSNSTMTRVTFIFPSA